MQMKEKNLRRKLALKKAKQKRERKKALHAAIADYMVETHMAQLPQPFQALKHWLGQGWKGYHQMRGRQLIGLFEEEFQRIASGPKQHSMVFYDRRKEYGRDLDRESLGEEATDDLRDKFTTQGNALLNQLIELAFDLDFED
jgi:hypothetical protein